MSSYLTLLMSEERIRDLRRAASSSRREAPSQPAVSRVTLRQASAADAKRLRYLAELDSAQPPEGSALIAEVDGRVRAALPLDGGAPIADPFHRSAELVELLRLRAAQLGRAAGPSLRA
jgi:hypothetical protein